MKSLFLLLLLLFTAAHIQSQTYQASFNTVKEAYYNPSTGAYDLTSKAIANDYMVQINEDKGLIVLLGGGDPIIITDVSRTDRVVVMDKDLRHIAYIGYTKGYQVGIIVFKNQVEIHFSDGAALVFYNVDRAMDKA